MAKKVTKTDEYGQIILDNKYYEEVPDLVALREKTKVEPEPFKEELEIYRDNILTILLDIVGQEITRLPDTQRDVMERYYFMDQNDCDISKILSISQQAAHKRRKKAVKTLRKRILNNPYAMELWKELKDSNPPLSLLSELANILEE